MDKEAEAIHKLIWRARFLAGERCKDCKELYELLDDLDYLFSLSQSPTLSNQDTFGEYLKGACERSNSEFIYKSWKNAWSTPNSQLLHSKRWELTWKLNGFLRKDLAQQRCIRRLVEARLATWTRHNDMGFDYGVCGPMEKRPIPWQRADHLSSRKRQKRQMEIRKKARQGVSSNR